MPEIIRDMEPLTEQQKAMVDENLNMVYSIARKYLNWNRDYDDLVHDGVFGLMRAVQKYDPDRGVKFSTYAWRWIKQTILRGIVDNFGNVRTTRHTHNKKRRMAALEKKCDSGNISDEELEELLKLDSDFLNSVMKKDFSLNVPVFKTGVNAHEFIDFIPSDEDQKINKSVNLNDLKKQVKAVLKTLSNKEERVVRLRFGLDDDRQRTLEEVGNLVGLTKERIRQLESSILHKLRHPKRSTQLRDFFNDI